MAEDEGGRVRHDRKRTKSVVGQSPNRDEYFRLMQAGWSSFALERYAAYRYGEQISASTFRNYRARVRLDIEPSALVKTTKPGAKANDNDDPMDILGARQDLAKLQMDRIAIDVKHEVQMGKLFGSTKTEIGLLAQLLSQVKEDQKDYGILPNVRAGEEPPAEPAPTARTAPRHRSLGEVIGIEDDPDAAAALAEALHKVLPFRQREDVG